MDNGLNCGKISCYLVGFDYSIPILRRWKGRKNLCIKNIDELELKIYKPFTSYLFYFSNIIQPIYISAGYMPLHNETAWAVVPVQAQCGLKT